VGKKSVLNIDVIVAIQAVFTPIFKAVENIWVYTIRFALAVIMVVGIHANPLLVQ
jgi:hypothetical protein